MGQRKEPTCGASVKGKGGPAGARTVTSTKNEIPTAPDERIDSSGAPVKHGLSAGVFDEAWEAEGASHV